MAITATYVSATSFTVAEDRRLWFVPGRAVRCDCGVNGVKFGYVGYSSYSSVTTVNLLSSESEALTNNLASVELSIFRPDSVNTGSAPLEDILMLRGFKTGMALEWKSTTEFYINVGSIHIDDGTYDRIYQVPSKLTKSVTGLSNSTWYHVYAAPPANGLTLTATEITYSTTAPSVDDTKGGKLYHPTDGTKRCIGWVYSDSSSNIAVFRIAGTHYYLRENIALQTFSDGNVNTSITVTCISPLASIYAVINGAFYPYSTTQAYCYVKEIGSVGTRTMAWVDAPTMSAAMFAYLPVLLDSNKQFLLTSSARATGVANTVGFIIPSSL